MTELFSYPGEASFCLSIGLSLLITRRFLDMLTILASGLTTLRSIGLLIYGRGFFNFLERLL